MPRYPAFDEAGLLLARRLTPLTLDARRDRRTRSPSSTAASSSQVELVLLDAPGPLRPRRRLRRARRGLPRQRACASRVLSRAVAELAQQRAADGTPFDVVHVNDWPTALVAKYLKDLGVTTPTRPHDPQRRAPGRLPEGGRSRRSASPGTTSRSAGSSSTAGQLPQAGHRLGRRGHDREPDLREGDPDRRATGTASTACSARRTASSAS